MDTSLENYKLVLNRVLQQEGFAFLEKRDEATKPPELRLVVEELTVRTYFEKVIPWIPNVGLDMALLTFYLYCTDVVSLDSFSVFNAVVFVAFAFFYFLQPSFSALLSYIEKCERFIAKAQDHAESLEQLGRTSDQLSFFLANMERLLKTVDAQCDSKVALDVKQRLFIEAVRPKDQDK